MQTENKYTPLFERERVLRVFCILSLNRFVIVTMHERLYDERMLHDKSVLAYQMR